MYNYGFVFFLLPVYNNIVSKSDSREVCTSRKVGAPQGRVLGNTQWGQPQG
jgi:hypothetical protein